PVSALTVDVLDPASAVALLTQGYGGRGQLTEEQWGSIAAWVGRLPLALKLLNPLLTTGGTTGENLLVHATRGTSTTPQLDAAMQALKGSVPSGALRGV